MAYAQARKDFEYLETIREIPDFVEIDANMIPFLRNPTKAFAASLYEQAIELWFSQCGMPDDRRARRIAERYYLEV